MKSFNISFLYIIFIALCILFYFMLVLGIQPSASHMLGKNSITDQHL
jgi:hypothetical protein